MPTTLIPTERIEKKIFLIRGHKVMLDQDLAKMYQVPTKALTQAVKRNIDRFPEDFMFQLTGDETENLRSQSVTSSWGGRRYSPYAFTEQGVSMLSSVLRSKRAIQVNVAIIRTFVKLRQLISTNRDLAIKLTELERKIQGHDEDIKQLFYAIQQLISPPDKPGRKIGFTD